MKGPSVTVGLPPANETRAPIDGECRPSRVSSTPADWHRVHYPAIACGTGLIIVDATAVSSEGRISPNCTGLWNNTKAEALAPIAASIKASIIESHGGAIRLPPHGEGAAFRFTLQIAG